MVYKTGLCFSFLGSLLSILLDLINFENCWILWNFVWDLFVSLLAIYLVWSFWLDPKPLPRDSYPDLVFSLRV